MFEENFNLQYDKYKQYILSLRKKAADLFQGSRNIDRLMEDKVEDYILLEEQPLPIVVGTRTIFVGNFTFQNEHKFFERWANIVGLLSARIVNMEIAEDRRKELFDKASFNLLAEGAYLYDFLLRDKWLFKRLCNLVDRTVLRQQGYFINRDVQKKIKWRNCSLRYFKKWITKEKLIQICFLIYFYNFDSVKKNVKILVEKMNMRGLAETYMYSWLQNCPGLTSKSTGASQADIDFAFRDDLSKPVQQNKQAEKATTTIRLNSEGENGNE